MPVSLGTSDVDVVVTSEVSAAPVPAIFVSLVPPLLQVNLPVTVSQAVGQVVAPQGQSLVSVTVAVSVQVGLGPGMVVVMVG